MVLCGSVSARKMHSITFILPSIMFIKMTRIGLGELVNSTIDLCEKFTYMKIHGTSEGKVKYILRLEVQKMKKGK